MGQATFPDCGDDDADDRELVRAILELLDPVVFAYELELVLN